MNVKQIYLYFLPLAACLLPSCASEAPDIVDVAKDSELLFAVSDMSRAATLDINTENSKFALFGEKMFQGVEYFHGPLVIFDGTGVVYNGKTWNYGKPQYWMPGHEYSFVALYPDSILHKPVFDYEYKNPTLSFTYSIPMSETYAVKKDTIVDIVVATHRRLYREGEDGRITLGFKHIMSMLDITPAVVDPLMYTGDDESRLDPDPNFNDQIIKNEFIQFRKVEFYGFKTKADFSVTPAPLNTAKRTDDNDVTIDVDYSLPYANMTIEFTEETAQHIVNSDPNNVKNYSIFAENDALIMLPHTLAPDAKMHMTYTVNTDTPEDPVIRHITISLNGMKLERGKHYKLCFTIEKVYEGQIREGSLRWIVTDISDKSANDNWISESDIIKQEFIVGDGQQ